MLQEEFVQSPHLRIPQKPQVPVISWQLVAFRSPGRLRRKRKSNKSVRFPMYLWLFTLVRGRIRSVTASANFSKALSPRDFMATCGFSLSRTFAPKAQKQQVCPFSYVLGAFAAPQRLRRKYKSNKYVRFSIYLWLFVHVRRRIHSVTASPNSSKAPSPCDFVATWGFCRSAMLAPKTQNS